MPIISETPREIENPTMKQDKTLIRKPLRKELGSLVKEFSQNTTVHGLAGLLKKRETANPLRWNHTMFLVAVLASFSFLAVNLNSLGDDYLQYPVTTTILRERRESIELPAITICFDYSSDQLTVRNTLL